VAAMEPPSVRLVAAALDCSPDNVSILHTYPKLFCITNLLLVLTGAGVELHRKRTL